MRALALALVPFTLCACSPKAEAPPPLPALDCAKGFAALSAELAANPALRQAPREPGEPYRFYLAQAGGAAFVVTEPGAPGHPAILKQERAGDGMRNSGCPFGDRAGYAEVEAYLSSLAAARR